MKQIATPDSSFWIHAVVADLIDNLLEDFELVVAPAVQEEMRETYASGALLHSLVREHRIGIKSPRTSATRRFGPGEREAISLAMEHTEWTLLIDDVRPFRAAMELGLAPVSSSAYLASLGARGLVSKQSALERLARLSARSTISPELIDIAMTQIERLGLERRK